MSGTPWENRSGYRDPTARAGERTLTVDEKRVTDLMHCIRQQARLAGFEITNRIEFRDLKSGRTFR